MQHCEPEYRLIKIKMILKIIFFLSRLSEWHIYDVPTLELRPSLPVSNLWPYNQRVWGNMEGIFGIDVYRNGNYLRRWKSSKGVWMKRVEI